MSDLEHFPKTQFRFLLPVPVEWVGLEHVEAVEDNPYTGWLPISHASLYTERLIDHYLKQESLTCCNFQGGFVIWIGDTCWNDYCVDEFSMTMNWYNALKALLQGQRKIDTFTWEQGYLKLERDGSYLLMSDVESYEVIVNFHDVVGQLLSEGRLFSDWIKDLHHAINIRIPLEQLYKVNEAFWQEIREKGERIYPRNEAEKLAQIIHWTNARYIDEIEEVARLLASE